MSRKKIVYIGVFLDTDSRMIISQMTQKTVRVFGDHCTLAFRPTPHVFRQVADGWLGKIVTLTDLYLFEEGGNAALSCSLPDGLPCLNAHPHVTLSTDGRPPRYSNELIGDGNGWVVHLPETVLRGRIGFFMRDRSIIYSIEDFDRF